MNNNKIIKRVNDLIMLGKEVEKTKFTRQRFNTTYIHVDVGRMSGFRSACLSFIGLLYGKLHPHFVEFEKTTQEQYLGNLAAGLGIMNAIRDEIAGGWLTTYKGIVSAEIFTDLIEMAEHLLEQGYKDPAAVVLGSVLEEHLRQLCLKTNIDVKHQVSGKTVNRKADSLNSDLAKAQVYNLLDQKSVTSWLDLRNKAAHGNYSEYTQNQVGLMLQGVMDFLSRNKI